MQRAGGTKCEEAPPWLNADQADHNSRSGARGPARGFEACSPTYGAA